MPNIRVRPSLAVEMKQRCLQSNEPDTENNGERKSLRTSQQIQRGSPNRSLKINDNLFNKKKNLEADIFEKDEIEKVNERVLTAMSKRRCKELKNEDRQRELLQKV